MSRYKNPLSPKREQGAFGVVARLHRELDGVRGAAPRSTQARAEDRGRGLCVIDGGPGLSKALNDVLGDLALVQHCQVHKLRNLRDHLPKKSHAYVLGAMREAYKASNADTARKRLKGVMTWIENAGHDDAAGSLREGLEETLTIIKLGLPRTLTRSLATTNPIENLMSSVRRVTLGIFSAQQRFRRIKGHKDMPILVKALRPTSSQPEAEHAVA
jgi:putative transposase